MNWVVQEHTGELGSGPPAVLEGEVMMVTL